ncbi:MAG: hypothetical protein PHH04_03260 [Thomasclavelia sp.]|nr:hypothetical protein [Thomasclavelia sp.]
MIFNQRRVSRDKKIIEDIIDSYEEDNIVADSRSKILFEDYDIEYQNLPTETNKYQFIEFDDLSSIKNKIEELIIYRFNRVYPKDMSLSIDVNKNYELEDEEEFVGNSHDKITKDTYRRVD